MIFVDTSYLLALAMPADSLHKRAVAWSSSGLGPLLTTEYVLCEMANSLASPVRRPFVRSLVAWAQTDPEVTLLAGTTEMFSDGLNLFYQRPDKFWSLTDCISFAVMNAHGIRAALTFDHHFEHAGYDALLRRDPQ